MFQVLITTVAHDTQNGDRPTISVSTVVVSFPTEDAAINAARKVNGTVAKGCMCVRDATLLF